MAKTRALTHLLPLDEYDYFVVYLSGGKDSVACLLYLYDIGVPRDRMFVQHHLVDVEVLCLPKNLPEFIEVDVSAMELNDALHLSDLKLPEGVKLVDLQHDDDQAVVSVQIPRVIEEPVVEEAEESAEVPTVGEEGQEGETSAEKGGEKKDEKKDDQKAGKDEKGGK